MVRSQHTTRITAAVVGATGVVLVVGAATASATPSADLRGGNTITAQVSGEKQGQSCRIAAAGIDMPWRAVGRDGTVQLDSGPVRQGRHDARIECENPRVGEASVHAVGHEEDVYTGHWAPAFEFLTHHRLQFLAPRD
ncbi:hypothetical protein KO481_26585 [Nocardia sp. NEAU-G5]|uniref:Uncharacterized protein n=1 Tax=Nocardia albiluteola TaxID=2842303 RepID=A0ABS6B5N2_9NOCA|nr:hypothetical protein [Nocardia albiluteola]MBU3065085.1 hypothetical protein [Nocardia albiluteola]